jgi:pimeloyl-ACP methyl ester carboxylesterase
MEVRSYGTSGPLVIVLHGGPGTAGHMAPVARGLAAQFRVLEPWQRGSGSEPLTVARHVEDLHELLGTVEADRETPPALVGSSWGAMLALAYAARHPDRAGPLVLIGCGTFDPAARRQLNATVSERMDTGLRQQLAQRAEFYPDADERLGVMGNLILPLYSYELLTKEMENVRYDARGHEETWADMIRLQEEGMFPAAFRAITEPVLMLHGTADPHPGPMIRASLQPYLPQLEYREWERCGHYPWLEKAVSDEFFTVLRGWLGRHLSRGEFMI